jgi:hypothetical protein
MYTVELVQSDTRVSGILKYIVKYSYFIIWCIDYRGWIWFLIWCQNLLFEKLRKGFQNLDGFKLYIFQTHLYTPRWHSGNIRSFYRSTYLHVFWRQYYTWDNFHKFCNKTYINIYNIESTFYFFSLKYLSN